LWLPAEVAVAVVELALADIELLQDLQLLLVLQLQLPWVQAVRVNSQQLQLE
jgi:hypothetical protein